MTIDDAETEARRRAAETKLNFASADDADIELLVRQLHSTRIPNEVGDVLTRLGFVPFAAGGPRPRTRSPGGRDYLRGTSHLF